jgi:hypothetical protein
MLRKQSIEQLLIRTEHPEFATVEARILDEAKLTISALARGKKPRTVLGGLMMKDFWASPGALDDVPRSLEHVTATAGIDVVNLNHRGDTPRDVLNDLVEIGWVEEFRPLPEESLDGSGIARYKLIDALAEVNLVSS